MSSHGSSNQPRNEPEMKTIAYVRRRPFPARPIQRPRRPLELQVEPVAPPVAHRARRWLAATGIVVLLAVAAIVVIVLLVSHIGFR